MTDNHRSAEPTATQETTHAMEQALDWLIRLDNPSEEQTRQFDAWLAADPRHGEAFARAQAIWNGPQVMESARQLAAAPKVTALSRLRAHWKPLEIGRAHV